jgi:hypothetical protein
MGLAMWYLPIFFVNPQGLIVMYTRKRQKPKSI